jgi:hypothetical protein
MILPDYTTNKTMIAAPLCDDCWALPKMVRLSRCFTLLKKMYKARTGKNIAFHFVGHQR